MWNPWSFCHLMVLSRRAFVKNNHKHRAYLQCSRRTSSQSFSPECGDMNAVCACGAAGLAELGLELRDLNPWGLWDAMLDPEELGKPFSQPAETKNWASGERSEGVWKVKWMFNNNMIFHFVKEIFYCVSGFFDFTSLKLAEFTLKHISLTCLHMVMLVYVGKAEVCVYWHRSAGEPQRDPSLRWEDIYLRPPACSPHCRALSLQDRGPSYAESDTEQKVCMENYPQRSMKIKKNKKTKKWVSKLSLKPENCAHACWF